MENKITYTHLVCLKRSPYYIYAESEEQAIEITTHYQQDEIVGVVIAKGNELELKEVRVKTSLESFERKALPEMIEVEEGTFQEIPGEEVSEEDKELLAEVDKEISKELTA